MASRPVFISRITPPFVECFDTSFTYFSGFALSQAQKSIRSLHDAFREQYKDPEARILEISSKSPDELGIRLSAFNLMYRMRDGSLHSVETVFQSSKCFENGKQYLDLLKTTSYNAKKDERLRTSGNVVAFKLEDREYPIKPTTSFYDWLYISALRQNPALANRLLSYSAFTDIAFNPERSLNCQARAAAVYVGLVRGGLLETALDSPEAFRDIVYDAGTEKEKTREQQLSIWDAM